MYHIDMSLVAVALQAAENFFRFEVGSGIRRMAGCKPVAVLLPMRHGGIRDSEGPGRNESYG